MRLKNLLCSETSHLLCKINLICPLSSHALVSLILKILYDPFVQLSDTYRKTSTGNQLSLNNLSHTPMFFFFFHGAKNTRMVHSIKIEIQ